MDDHTTLDTQVIEIPLNQLHDSPFNPRKTYDDKGLQELADTMRPPHGRVLQPVVVRVMPKSPRPLLDGVDTFTDYELVFGHRRKRGAQLAGLATVPAIVRTMTDEEGATRADHREPGARRCARHRRG
jgi:ParB/RepB/Spo0J family partition protein